MGLPRAIVQINRCHSSRKHTLRGMHYQLPPHAETKIISCLAGSILDVIIDLRPDSKTFMQHHAVELHANESKCVCVPQGCAHGYFTLTNTTEVLYCVDEYYNPELERGVRWNDPAFAISWPAQPQVISDKDANHPNFSPAIHLPTNQQ